ncbi:hypothetical protein JQC91_09910 [Jannaschia sp. Os4]|uniref:YIP1 family protein n=1 Tax=Jannaschia sp. Os4 TaxID=2807617 RepID=UPI00193A6617|nr:YIP1 family protein [Jannaschia sp. Os4]MBM2576619.1 hypothetical protein [Jannaschia sp. Os4]
MSVATDIPRAWVRPATVMAEKLARRPDERVAFVYVAVASVLGFASTLPGLQRRARASDPEFEAAIVAEAGEARIMQVPADLTQAKFEALMSGALMSWLFVVPILLYVVAWASHLLAKLAGGRGTGLGARIALFWAALVAVPGLLLTGLTTGLVGEGPEAAFVAVLTACVFLWVWINSLYVAERGVPA